MNISEFNLYIKDDENEKSLQLIYRGNENIIIRQITRIGTDQPTEREVLIPRALLEQFVRIINET